MTNPEFSKLRSEYFERRLPVRHGMVRPLPWGVAGSDVVSHLPVLEYFASKCDHVTEFGVREAHSTVALISGCPGTVVSYDVAECPIAELFEEWSRKDGLPCEEYRFVRADTADPDLEIEDTDLLFVDTLHVYDHVRKELSLHGRKARKYLIFHDTHTCGEFDLSGPDPTARGILPAIGEFLADYPGEYVPVYETKVNNGLIVYERTGKNI